MPVAPLERFSNRDGHNADRTDGAVLEPRRVLRRHRQRPVRYVLALMAHFTALYFGRAHTGLAAALRSVVRPAARTGLTPVVLRGCMGASCAAPRRRTPKQAAPDSSSPGMASEIERARIPRSATGTAYRSRSGNASLQRLQKRCWFLATARIVSPSTSRGSRTASTGVWLWARRGSRTAPTGVWLWTRRGSRTAPTGVWLWTRRGSRTAPTEAWLWARRGSRTAPTGVWLWTRRGSRIAPTGLCAVRPP